jgi:predicted membrane protein
MNDEKQEGRSGQMVLGIHLGKNTLTGGVLWGVLITVIGIALLLDHLGVINVDHFWRFWPLILIFVGIGHLSQRQHRLWGIILVVAGFLLQLNQLGFAHFSWAVIWPILLIAVGVLIMWGSLEGRTKPAISTFASSEVSSSDPRTTLNETVVFGGIERRVTTQNFQGGQITAVFGGVELDLRDANMQADDATLELNALFGGVELRLPDTWHVSFRGTPIFGGLSDKSSGSRAAESGDTKSKVLFLTGSVIFGGVEIKN